MNNMTLEQQVTEAYQNLKKEMEKLYSNQPSRIIDLEEQEEYIKEYIKEGIIDNRGPLQAHHVSYLLYE